jgi:tRNA(Ile)-lysidine synthase
VTAPDRPRDEPAPPPGPLPAGRPRDELVAEVARALAPVPHGVAVVVAASGGPDSAALAFLAAEARPDLAITLGHVRHGLRDDADDLAAVRAHASFLGAPLAVEEVTVADGGDGLEAAARRERHAALGRIAREVGAGWLLLGHTADDQAETVAMRLVRGTGLTGLTGMAPVRGGLLRPLLRLRRDDVRAFVVGEGVPYVTDPMNLDESFTRVVARQRVLPALRDLGHDPVVALARLADLVREDAATLQAQADAAVRDLARGYGPCVAVPTERLEALPRAVASRVVRRLVVRVRGGGAPPTADLVGRVLALTAGAAVEVGDVTATCGGGWTAFAPRDLAAPLTMPLVVPGTTRWSATGCEVVAVDRHAAHDDHAPQLQLDLPSVWTPPSVEVDPQLLPPGGDPDLGQVVLAEVPDGAVLRARRRGDRVRTAVGTRKVQDVLVDAGVPRAMRDLVPLVAAGAQVLWIPGVAVDAEAAQRGRRAPGVHLSVRPARPRSAAAVPGGDSVRP